MKQELLNSTLAMVMIIFILGGLSLMMAEVFDSENTKYYWIKLISIKLIGISMMIIGRTIYKKNFE